MADERKPAAGDKAPDFELPASGGKTIKLSEAGKKGVVLYFYPKDDTSGCTREAIEFTGALPEFQKLGVAVIGLSPDPVKKHDRFIDKHDLKVDLVSDEDKSVLEAYDAWVEKSMYGRKYMGVERSTFLIDSSGTVRRVWRKVKVAGHVEEVLEEARQL